MTLSRFSTGAVLLAFFTLLYLLPLNLPYLWQPDETRYAEISREMVETGDWVVPRMLGLHYFEKPVAGYWVNNISQIVFGHSNFAARFGVAFCTGLSAALVFALAFIMWRRREEAFTASLIYLSLALVVGVGTYNVLDPILTTWMTAAMLCSYLALNAQDRAKRAGAYALLGLACGMGFLTKGFIALAIPVVAVFPVAVLQKRLRELFLLGPIAILTATAISLPWSLAVHFQEPDYWRYFFWVEHIQRFTGESNQHIAPFWFYIPIFVVAAIPWLGLMPGALLQGWKKRLPRPELFFLLSWVVMPILFFSSAKGKLLTYILPCMAPLALLLAAYARDQMNSATVFKANALVNMLVSAVLLLAVACAAFGWLPQGVVLSEAEWYKPIVGVVLVAFFGVLGWVIFHRPVRYWLLAAVYTPLIFWGYVFLLPDAIAQSKQPQIFIREHLAQLQNSRYVLSNELGVATGLAWELRRSDILLYNRRGELGYGIERAKGLKRPVIDVDEFEAWLEEVRPTGDSALVFRSSRTTEDVLAALPLPDTVYRIGRHILIMYKQR